MPELILPDVVLHNMELERSLEKMGRLRQRAHDLRALEDALKQIDPMLSLVKAQEKVENPNVRPGYWHVRRSNAPFPDTYLTIEGPNGEFVEPHSGVLDVLREQDTRRQGWFDEFRMRKVREKRDREKNRLLLAEDRREELATRIKAYDNPGVAFGTRGWTYRAGARKGD